MLGYESKAERLPLNAVNHWMQTPLAAAAIKRQDSVADILAKAGGKLACSMHEAFYPLHMAALVGDVGAPPGCCHVQVAPIVMDVMTCNEQAEMQLCTSCLD